MHDEYHSWAKERGVERLPRKQRISVDEYGLALAEVVKLRAACTRRQVGAVILDAGKRVLATGYNGTEPGAVECMDGGCPRGAYTHAEIPGFLGNAGHKIRCVARHAEWNAVDFAARVRGFQRGSAGPVKKLDDCTIYVSCQPCPECAELCERYGLRTVWAG